MKGHHDTLYSSGNIFRLSLYAGGVWGRVCGVYNNSQETPNVVCRQLGYKGAVAAVDGAIFGEVGQSLPTWLSGVYCGWFQTKLQVRVHCIENMKC